MAAHLFHTVHLSHHITQYISKAYLHPAAQRVISLVGWKDGYGVGVCLLCVVYWGTEGREGVAFYFEHIGT